MGGGANRSMIQLILELRNNHGINPIVLAPKGKLCSGDHGVVDECKKNDIPVERAIIPWFIHSKIWLHRFKYLAMFLTYPALIKRLKQYDIELVHSNGSVFDIGARISNSLGIPHIWHLREFGSEDASFKPVWGEMYIKKAYSSCTRFIAISAAIKNSYKNVINPQHIVRIYNGIDEKKYKKYAPHTNEIIQFVIVGVVTPHKNQMESVLAINELVKGGVTNFHLNIIGQENKTYVNEMKKYICDHDLLNYVSFWGMRNDVPDILSKMDVGLMLSRTEAFGRVTIEYMMQNLVVIASDTGANPELIQNRITGFLYHLGDIMDLANRMKELILDKTLLKKVSETSRRYAIENFSSVKNSNSVFKLYKSML